MQGLRIRKARAPIGTRRFNPPRKGTSWRRPVGPWPPLHALYYRLLQEFARREGHARVPARHREGGFSLGLWVIKRRTHYRKGLLTPEQVRSLERVPRWTWSLRDDAFRGGLEILRAFARRVGHARVPHGHRENGFPLGYWVLTRRQEHARGRLSADRVAALEAVPGWSWKPLDEAFEMPYEALRRFAKREGHARVPYAHREGRVRLGAWVGVQRHLQAEGRLSRERARRLESVRGWSWSGQTDHFGEGMRALQAFVRREGHARVPARWVEGGFRLGLWVVNRRADHRKGNLSSAQERALERQPGWTWSLRAASFHAAYSLLVRFVKREGHARVPSDHVEAGSPLGAWVHRCRGRREALSRDQVRRLAALPGWAWNRFDWQFEERLRLLRVFVKREKHCQVPRRHVESGVRLGEWFHHCRDRRQTLVPRRRRALEAVPGWTWKHPKRQTPRGLVP